MARRKIKYSLRAKITALIFTLVIITMGVVFSYSLHTNLAMQQREIRKSAKQVSDTLNALRLITPVESTDANWAVYQKYMELLAKLDRNIMVMAIIDQSKNLKAFAINEPVIAKDFKEITIDADKKKTAESILSAKIKDVLKVKSNLKIKGETFSEIEIKFSKKQYNRQMNITILNMAILTAVLLAAGFFSANFLAKFITGNFNIIAAGMRKVAGGNLDVEVEVKANDEVGVLADDFNRMIVELKEKVRIKDAFETVAGGLKDMDDLKKAYQVLTYQEMTDKITRGYTPPAGSNSSKSVFIFIDVSSFSNFTYELISPEMKEIIEKFTEKVSMTALEYQGAVLKATDSYVLLSFGYPFMHADDTKRALISTVEIRKELVAMVKSKLTLGYEVEDFSVNFIMINGSVAGNFISKQAVDAYTAVVEYLKFASRYGERKKYGTDIYALGDMAQATSNLANYEKIDSVTASEGASYDLMKLKGTRF